METSKPGHFLLAYGLSLALGFSATAATAQLGTCGGCPGAQRPVFVCAVPGTFSGGTPCPTLQPDTTCVTGFPHSQRPRVTGPELVRVPDAGGGFRARMILDVKAPHNASASNPAEQLDMFWYPSGMAGSGTADLCQHTTTDWAQTYVEAGPFGCGDVPQVAGTYALRAQMLQGISGTCCRPRTDVSSLRFVVTPTLLGCGAPRESACNGDAGCQLCLGPGQSASSTGGGPAVGGRGQLGPGADVRYAAGGVGGIGLPGSAAWNSLLGRFWSHDYTERIVQDPDVRHVWLLTRFATFREFTDAAGDGLYELASPRDEYRTLRKTAGGWELTDLDGTVDRFDGGGLWLSSTDRFGNAKSATYSSGLLSAVDFPDGRRETFGYTAGRLTSITEIGVGGSLSRTWNYLWSGNDLVEVRRPDGTAYRFEYGAPQHPGYLTREILVGTDGSQRTEAAWEYDDYGNVVRTWKGAASFDDPLAVEKYQLGYDTPGLPQRTDVTIAVRAGVNDLASYSIAPRTAMGKKPRITAITGGCPACGSGPNSQFSYDDAVNPLRVTREVDGREHVTLSTYDAHGQKTSRTEAFGTPAERTTTWTYHATFPALVTRVEVPSTVGGLSLRVTANSYDSHGALTTHTESGVESGNTFSLATAFTPNTGGQVLATNPPDFGNADVTAWTYDGTRGNGQLVPLTRSEPLIGATSFGHDAFNRRTSETDPNGVTTETSYDNLNRVLSVNRRGATAAGDLVTTYTYNPLGDLFRVTLPRGNVLEYGYDAAGRPTTLERKPDASTHGERTLWAYDTYGHKVREDLQSWSGTAWVTASFAESRYDNRCQIAQSVAADGTATEYSYDCNGNLERLWDANHPRATNPTATSTYTYDELDRVSSVAQPWAGGGAATTAYAYDIQDHLARVTDAEGNETTYLYSDRDLLTEQNSVVSGQTAYQYDAHGNLVEETDARPVTVLREYDALDRVIRVDYPTGSLDTTYTYDDPSIPFSKGRLTAITRNGERIDSTYDRFGRILQDGAMSYAYDKNGNRTSVIYPGGVASTTAYDFADRPASLTLDDAGTPRVWASDVTYQPFGPLAGLTFGNSVAESRTYDNRYRLSRVQVGGALDWSYTHDNVGNITQITDNNAPAATRSYAYLDALYFLTQGNGPWGTRSWTYDKIGNRLSESKDGVLDPYVYAQQGSPPHNTPKLLSRTNRAYGYDAIGNQTSVNATPFAIDEAKDLAGIDGTLTFSYDGRGYLRHVTKTPLGQPTETADVDYSSDGVLQHRHDVRSGGSLTSDAYFFYLGSRPVGVLEKFVFNGVPSTTLRYLTTDEIGAPIVATGPLRRAAFLGGFEPFGADVFTAQNESVPLRFLGQWQDDLWVGYSKRFELHYNVHRWYDNQTGRYTQPDPMNNGRISLIYPRTFLLGDPPYLFAIGNPLRFSDRLGLDPEQAQCVLKWTLASGLVGSMIGAGVGCLAEGAAGTFLAPGVGTVGGCGAGLVNGGILGGGAGLAGGAIIGTIACQCPDDKNRDSGRWTCEAKCHINNFSGVPGAPSFVFGMASGSSESSACRAAMNVAQQKSPPGTYTRHCRCTQCWKK